MIAVFLHIWGIHCMGGFWAVLLKGLFAVPSKNQWASLFCDARFFGEAREDWTLYMTLERSRAQFGG